MIKYQEANGLFGDGIVGDKTWNSMYETIKGEELKAYGDAGNINAYYADSELNTEGMKPYMYREEKTKKRKSGFIPALMDYRDMYKDLPDKAEADGEVQNAEKRAAQNAEDSALTKPAVKMLAKDEVEDMGEMAAYTMGYYG